MKEKLIDEVLSPLQEVLMFPVDEATLHEFLAIGEYVEYGAKKYVISPDKADDNLYLMLDGLVRFSYKMSPMPETTFVFLTKGCLFLSGSGWCTGEKPFHYVVTCTKSKVLRFSKQQVVEAMLNSSQLALGMFGAMLAALNAAEQRQKNYFPDFKDRIKKIFRKEDPEVYNSLRFDTPNLMQVVPDKVMASYLNVHPAYYSRMKKELIEEERQAMQDARRDEEERRRKREEADRRLREMGIEPDAD